MNASTAIVVAVLAGAGCSSSSTSPDSAAPDALADRANRELAAHDSVLRGADASCDPVQSKACFALCRGVAATPAEFACHGSGTAAELSGTTTLASASTTGCSGTLITASASLSLWLHCDACRVCLDRETECYSGDFGTGLFSCAVSQSALTCTKK